MAPLAWLLDFDRATSRMHNKALIFDNQVAIVGGRNVGDEYFGAAGDVLFADLDVMAIGPVVEAVSHAVGRAHRRVRRPDDGAGAVEVEQIGGVAHALLALEHLEQLQRVEVDLLEADADARARVHHRRLQPQLAQTVADVAEDARTGLGQALRATRKG